MRVGTNYGDGCGSRQSASQTSRGGTASSEVVSLNSMGQDEPCVASCPSNAHVQEKYSDTSAEPVQSDEYEWEELDDLVNNCVGSTLSCPKVMKRYVSIERCLVNAGIRVNRRQLAPSGHVLLDDRRKPSTDSFISFESAGSALSEGLLCEKELIRGLMGKDGHVVVGRQHLFMDTLVRSVFVHDESRGTPEVRRCDSEMRKVYSVASAVSWSNFPTSSDESRLKAFWQTTLWPVRRRARKVVTNSAFTNFYLLLTFYMLMGPDLIPLLDLSLECNLGFHVANIVTLGLFCLELVLMLLGSRTYVFSLVSVLDVVALVSILGDTVFWRDCGSLVDGNDGRRLSRAAQVNRITRLVRLTRVAKVARLMPRMMRLLQWQTLDFSKMVLERKVWRAFHILDTDEDGFATVFDLKVFYFAVLQGCSHITGHRPSHLQADTAFINDTLKPDRRLDFTEFSRAFMATQVGRELLTFYAEDIETGRSVWSLTNRISEAAALKVCALVMLLMVGSALLEAGTWDRSPEQSLVQLEFLAKSLRGDLSANGTYLCEQIRLYAERHNVLFLFLGGWTYLDGGQCLPSGLPRSELDPFQRVETLAAERLTISGALLACWPGSCLQGETTSMSLLDQSADIRWFHAMGLVSSLCLLVALLTCVYLLKSKVKKFTGTFVIPLRSLADDMVAMSSLEMLNSEETFLQVSAAQGMAYELTQVNENLGAMRSAIRSWSKYVPPSVVERLFSEELEATIGVASCNVSILFCDIDGFEDACRGLEPSRVLSLLSDVIGTIADVILAREGTLLEFIGDEVLAVFNTPNQMKHHPFVAVASALQIHTVIKSLPRITLAAGKETSIRCRCGVHTANVYAGNIGSRTRMKYGLLGDGVNLAARLKSLNSRYHTWTLVSEDVLTKSISQRFVSRPVDVVAVKGRKNPTTVLEVLGARIDCGLELTQAALKHREAFRLYQLRKFTEAKAIFEDVVKLMQPLTGHDEASASMAQRCATYIARPPAADWDGVERLTKKAFSPPPAPEESLAPRALPAAGEKLRTVIALGCEDPPPLPPIVEPARTVVALGCTEAKAKLMMTL